MPEAKKYKKKSKKRDQILSEAVRLFNQSGYHDTRLEDIATNLGKTKTSVSYHFQSKEALLEEAFARSCAFTEEEYIRASKKCNGLERILQLVRNRAELHADALAGRVPPPALLYNTETVRDISQPDLIDAYNHHICSLYEFVIQGIKDDSVEVISAEATTFFILNILHWLPEWLVNLPNAHHLDAIDGLCEILRYGIVFDKSRTPLRTIMLSRENNYPSIFNREVRNQLKKDAIVRTGTRFLNLYGFRSLSLNDIANELGVTRGAFYYYIADKETLLEECFDRALNSIEASLFTAKKHNHLDKLGVLEQSLLSLFEGHITGLDPLIRINLLHAISPIKRMAVEAKLRRIRAAFSEAIAEAMVDKSVRAIDINTLENLIFGSIFSASEWRLSSTPLAETWKPAIDPTKASQAYYQVLFTGLASTN